MTAFSSRNQSTAVVPAAIEQIWDALSDATTLAALTPMVRRIDVDGDRWRWHLRGVAALGVSVAPVFTELMTFTEPHEIRFEHRPPPGRAERASADGVYLLESVAAERTRLSIDITLCVDLPLPRLSRRAVEPVIARAMQQTGDRFAANLSRRLGIGPATESRPVSTASR